jgi:hypothetical protein
MDQTDTDTPPILMTHASGKLVKNQETGAYFLSPFFTLDEAATFLGVGPATVRDLVRNKELIKRHRGQAPYHVEDLNQYALLARYKAFLTSTEVSSGPSAELPFSKTAVTIL